jgi:chemotaxis regulatin CheY-phosphate phosphatase CheZ
MHRIPRLHSTLAVASAAMMALGDDFGDDGPTQQKMDDAVAAMSKRLDEEVADLADLEPPADLAHGVDAMLASVRDVAAKVKDQGAALFQAKDDPFAEADEMAKDLGLDECAS